LTFYGAIQFVNPGLSRQFIGMKPVRDLEQTAQFLRGLHLPLDHTGLQPDHSVLVKKTSP
jgi:hypothetical protein